MTNNVTNLLLDPLVKKAIEHETVEWIDLLEQELGALHARQEAWAQKAILNVASSGKFSSDRTIAEYASDIWKVQPCPVP